MDDAVPTPPCTTSVEGAFGFDGQGRLYYRCSIRLMRGNGELLATDVNELAGVLADGRTIVYREVMNPPALQFEVPAGRRERERAASRSRPRRVRIPGSPRDHRRRE